jgi:hypothetical protein
MTLYPWDRVRINARFGCFKGMRGRFVEMRGDRVAVLLDGDVGPTLFFAREVVFEEPEPHMTAGG